MTARVMRVSRRWRGALAAAGLAFAGLGGVLLWQGHWAGWAWLGFAAADGWVAATGRWPLVVRGAHDIDDAQALAVRELTGCGLSRPGPGVCRCPQGPWRFVGCEARR